MTDLKLRIPALHVLLPSLLFAAACQGKEGLLTAVADDSTSMPAGESGDSETGALAASLSETSASGAGSDEGVTGGGTLDPMDTDEPPETGGQGGLLAGCALEDPCPELEFYCDFDGCASELDEDEVCAWNLLRDGAVARISVIDGVVDHDRPVLLVPLGDGERTVLRELQNGSGEVLRCTLSPPDYFQNCIDNGAVTDSCFELSKWLSACAPEDAPACPAG